MLEHYYVRPDSADRVRSSWVGDPIEKYVGRLTQQRYASRTVLRRIPLLMEFGEFARRWWRRPESEPNAVLFWSHPRRLV